MPDPKKDSVFIANTSGSCEVGGQTYPFVKGVTRVRGDHPLRAATPEYWDPVDDKLHYDVEQATAAPGEKRGQARRKAAS